MQYKSQPQYEIYVGNGKITFDRWGFYETTNAREIKVLDGLVPRYIQKIGGNETNEPEVTEGDSKPTTAAKRKTSAK